MRRTPCPPRCMADSTPDNPSDDERSIQRGPWLGLDGPLVQAVAVSFLVHAIIGVLLMTVKTPDIDFDVDFRESRGVALMSQIGFAPADEGSGEEEFVDVDEIPEEGDDTETEDPDAEPAEPEGSGSDSPPEDPTGSEDPEQDPGEEQEPEEQDPAENDPTEPVEPTPETDPGQGPGEPTEPTEPAEPDPPSPGNGDPEPENNDNSENDGEGEGTGEPDPADLPPRQRYPEGTVNPVATDVGMWGPEGAASVALIRSDRIRRSPHRSAVETIFGGLGDYTDLSENTGVNVIDDVDAMLLASTDITDSSRTFIAAVHGMNPAYLMGELARGYPSGVNWEERNGRYWGTPGAFNTFSRRFFIPTEELLIYTQPEFLDPLMDDAPRARGLDGALEASAERLGPPPTLDAILVELGLPETRPEPHVADGHCSDRSGPARRRCQDRQEEQRNEADRAIAAYDAQRAELLPRAEALLEEREDAWDEARSNGRRNRADRSPPVRGDEAWISGLLEIGDLAGTGDDGPAILWTFNGFDAFNLGGLRRGTAAPQQLVASLELGRDPVLNARFVFANAEEAEDFRDQWGAVVEHYTFPLTAAGLLRAFRGAEWEMDHNEAIATINVPSSSMNRLALAVGMMGR